MEWIINNWEGVTVAIMAVVTLASAIANLTPSDTDNKVVEKIASLIDTLALNIKKPVAK